MKEKQPQKRRVGRPGHVPTDEIRRQVELCTTFGNTVEQTAKIVKISEPTLRRYYADQLENGRVVTHFAVKSNLFRLATMRDLRAVKAIQLWMTLVERAPAPEMREMFEAGLGKKLVAERLAKEPPPVNSRWNGLLQ